MRAFHLLALACGAALLNVAGLPAQEPTAKQPPEAAALKHGAHVTFQQKGETVRGTVVWQDRANNRVYVRTKPGERPTPVALGDIKGVQPVTPVAGAKEKGGVRFAADADEPPALPDSHTMVIYNGDVRTVHFFDNSLSAAERERLRELDRAADDVLEAEAQLQRRRAALDRPADVDVVPAARPYVPAPLLPPAPVLPAGAAGTLLPEGYLGAPVFPGPFAGYGVGLGGLGLGGYGLGGYGLGSPYFSYPYYSVYYSAYSPVPVVPPAPQPTVIVNAAPAAREADRGDQTKSLAEAREQLRQARASYEQASRRLVVEDGRIVAVRLDEDK